jgi:hypothetical protein
MPPGSTPWAVQREKQLNLCTMMNRKIYIEMAKMFGEMLAFADIQEEMIVLEIISKYKIIAKEDNFLFSATKFETAIKEYCIKYKQDGRGK